MTHPLTGNQNAAKPPELRRDYDLRVSLTPAERKTVEEKAKAKGMTKAEFARMRLLK